MSKPWTWCTNINIFVLHQGLSLDSWLTLSIVIWTVHQLRWTGVLHAELISIRRKISLWITSHLSHPRWHTWTRSSWHLRSGTQQPRLARTPLPIIKENIVTYLKDKHYSSNWNFEYVRICIKWRKDSMLKLTLKVSHTYSVYSFSFPDLLIVVV